MNTCRVQLRYELFCGNLTERELDASEKSLVEYIESHNTTKAYLMEFLGGAGELGWPGDAISQVVAARMVENKGHRYEWSGSGPSTGEARIYLKSIFPSPQGAFFECTGPEGEKAFLHRFAGAGAAVRYRTIHHREVEDIVALDMALRRNDPDWFETLPDEIARPIIHKLYYGHFFCHVFHQDYIVRKGHNTMELEHRMWKLLDARGAQYPAEHNVGHLYEAKPELANHYRGLDPCNCFNPGIGRTTKLKDWRESALSSN